MLGDFNIRMENEKTSASGNYIANESTFSITKNGKSVASLTPEIRRYNVRDTSTTEAAIHSGFFYDIYLVIGKTFDGNATTIRAYINPFMNILWTGCLLMVLGGIVSIRRTLPKETI